MAGAGLTGCGFQPAFGPGGTANALKDQVYVDSPTDKNAFDLVERLEQRLGRTSAPRYGLAYVIKTEALGVGISPENAITRFNVTGSVSFTLRNHATGETLTSGLVQSFTGYSTTGTTVSTLTAERDASARLMVMLADQIVARLIATSGTWQR